MSRSPSSRRAALLLALFAFSRPALAGGPPAVVTIDPARSPVEIAPGTWLLAGVFAPGRQPDGNSVLLEAPGGWVVVDTGRHLEHTRALVEFARGRNRPIATVVNSHWHLDHLGGNALLRREFPALEVLASGAFDGARTGFLAKYRKYLEDTIAKAEGAGAAPSERAELALLDAAPALAPDEVVAASGRRLLAGRELEVRLAAHAVTAGDLWLLDPATATLIAGDLVTLPVPFLDTACPVGWRAALDELARADFTRLVPGHGQVMSRGDFERYRGAFGNLLDCAASDRAQAACAEGWLADLGALLPATEHAFARQLLDYYLDAALRADPASRAALCAD